MYGCGVLYHTFVDESRESWMNKLKPCKDNKILEGGREFFVDIGSLAMMGYATSTVNKLSSINAIIHW